VLLVRRILGHVDEPPFAGRPVDGLPLDSTDATKRRLRARTRGDVDVALDLERGAYLFAGAVLDDDGRRLIAVERAPEEALIVRFSPALDHGSLVERAARIGHALGNQHVPVELQDGELRAPVTTSRDVMLDSISRLGLDGIELDVAEVPLGREHPLERPGHHHG
jgi:urease accessory protein